MKNLEDKLTKVEKVVVELEEEIKKDKTKINKSSKVYKVLTCTLGAMLFLEKQVLAAPSTGFNGLDEGMWKIVTIFQAAVFWLAMLYTLRALAMLVFKGEGHWKNVATGFLVCIANYLVPWLFGMVPGLFNF